MTGPDRQFDPVANATLGAIRASNRSLTKLQQETPVPELPSQNNVTRQLRTGVASVSSYSPFNTFLGGNGGGGGSSMASSLPGAETELPDPAGVFGGSVTLTDLAPHNIINTLSNGSAPMPPTPGNGNNGASRGSGSSSDSAGGTGDANAPTPSRGAGASR